jgi:hypothetical protein
LTEVSEELTVSIIRVVITLMAEAVSSSEILVSIYKTTLHNIQEDRHLISVSSNFKTHNHKSIILSLISYGYKIQSLTLREEHILQVLERKVQRKILVRITQHMEITHIRKPVYFS